MFHFRYFLIFTCFIALGCDLNRSQDLISGVEDVHRKREFQKKDAVEFDFHLTFGGKQRMDAHFLLDTDSWKGRIEQNSGPTIVYSGDDVFSSISDYDSSRVRFDAFTWSYFFLLPYKLSDPGTHWQEYINKGLNGEVYLTRKLSFKQNTGDAPDDWYIVYADQRSHLLHAAAYIVTSGKSKEEAEKNPHAVVYEDYRVVDGIPIAHRWTFWEWNPRRGLTKQIGEAQLEQVKFIDPEVEIFNPSPEFVSIPNVN